MKGTGLSSFDGKSNAGLVPTQQQGYRSVVLQEVHAVGLHGLGRGSGARNGIGSHYAGRKWLDRIVRSMSRPHSIGVYRRSLTRRRALVAEAPLVTPSHFRSGSSLHDQGFVVRPPSTARAG